MKRLLSAAVLALTFTALSACGKKTATEPAAPAAPTVKVITSADLSAMAAAVPNTGPREGNGYKVFFLVLRQNQAPAAGFNVDMSVKGKSEPKTVVTNESGLAQFDDLPFPDAKHPLVGSLHYSTGKGDDPREITYPFIDSDGYRLKDTQYIPNTATPQ